MLTLNKIRGKSPCQSGWNTLMKSMGKTEADDTRVSIAHLLESNGKNDTLWVIFRCIPDQLEKKRNMIADIVEPAIEAAESVLHIFEKKYPDDKRPRKAIENAKENVRRSRLGLERLPRPDVAYAAGADNAAYAAYAAVYAAAGADNAAYAAYADNAAYAAVYAAVYAADTDAADAVYAAGADNAAVYAADTDARQEARKKSDLKSKEIILKYFGDY